MIRIEGRRVHHFGGREDLGVLVGLELVRIDAEGLARARGFLHVDVLFDQAGPDVIDEAELHGLGRAGGQGEQRDGGSPSI